jgi:hypothetical protein
VASLSLLVADMSLSCRFIPAVQALFFGTGIKEFQIVVPILRKKNFDARAPHRASRAASQGTGPGVAQKL